MSVGVDYAFNPHPSISAMKGAGVRFVCRYISTLPTNDANGKNLIPSECKALLGAGFKIVMVVEEGESMMLGGHSAGVAAAKHADAVVKALNMGDMPIYFAADFDATPAQQAPINACLDGAAEVVGRKRVGLYGGYHVLKRAFDAGKCRYGWQTIAWSGGQWDRRAHIRQGLSFNLGGASVDHDQAMFADYGQFPRPQAQEQAQEPANEHHADGKQTIGQIASSRNMTSLGWIAHQEDLNAGDADRLLDSAVPKAGATWWTNP